MTNKKTSTSTAIASCMLLSSGCASITGTENQSISVQTREQTGREISGAACELSNEKGKWFVTTPGSVIIHRSNDDMQVVCNKVGLDSGRASVTSATKGSMFGNLVFGGGVGAIIDHNKGTAYEYPNLIQIVMGAFTKIDAPDLNANPAPSPSTATPATHAGQQTNSLVAEKPSVSLDDGLKELKRLYDSGLITKDVYAERQRLLLDARR